MPIIIRALTQAEHPEAIRLAMDVFMQFEGPDYSQQGIDAFSTALRDPAFLDALRIYGALDGDSLVGILATRNSGSHIALFFVKEAYQKKGIGKQLFLLAAQESPSDKMTVHASPYALEVYRRLGFRDTAPEQLTDGIRYTPMECCIRNAACPCKRIKCHRHGQCVLCRAYHAASRRKPFPSCERPEKKRRRER